MSLLAGDRWACPASRHLSANSELLSCEGQVAFQDSQYLFVARASLSDFEAFITNISASTRDLDWQECDFFNRVRVGDASAFWCRYSLSHGIKEEAAWHEGRLHFSYFEW